METWNPWHGCRKISEGCLNCYMYFLDSLHGRSGSDISRVKGGFDLPVKKDKSGSYKIPAGSVLHLCLTSDFFLEEADQWRDEVWAMIKQRPDVTFRILTKRACRIKDQLPPDWGNGWKNVTLSVTAENQKRADERLPYLLDVPAVRKCVMVAPFIDVVDLSPYLATGQIASVTADGENYENARPCRYEWVKSLYDQCVRFDVSFNFGGTGELFIKDGRTYKINGKQKQLQALKSGLQYISSREISKNNGAVELSNSRAFFTDGI